MSLSGIAWRILATKTQSAPDAPRGVAGGTYECVADSLNVRSAPGLSGAVVASYESGETVLLDDWGKEADGYLWGRYTSYSGETRYIALGTSSGSSDHRNASMCSARAQQRFLFPLFFMLLFLPDQWFYNIYHPMLHGCFWHRCPHCNLSLPKSNVEYWVVKFARNVERDEQSRAALEALGWKVHVVWECQLKKKAIDATMAELLPVLAEELDKELVSGALTDPA